MSPSPCRKLLEKYKSISREDFVRDALKRQGSWLISFCCLAISKNNTSEKNLNIMCLLIARS